MNINQATIALVKKWEGLGDGDKTAPGLQPYLCPAGYWTVGYGRVVLGPSGEMLKGAGTKSQAYAAYPNGITAEQADAFLKDDLQKYGASLLKYVKAPLTENQYGACVAFAYNVGIAAFAGSTLLKKINEKKYTEAAEWFLPWNKITNPKTGQKEVSKGLSNRRNDERALFLTP